jgi:hypothetical protein
VASDHADIRVNLPATLPRRYPNVRQSFQPNRVRPLRLPCGPADGGGLLDQSLGVWAKPGPVDLILAGTSTVGTNDGRLHRAFEDAGRISHRPALASGIGKTTQTTCCASTGTSTLLRSRRDQVPMKARERRGDAVLPEPSTAVKTDAGSSARLERVRHRYRD